MTPAEGARTLADLVTAMKLVHILDLRLFTLLSLSLGATVACSKKSDEAPASSKPAPSTATSAPVAQKLPEPSAPAASEPQELDCKNDAQWKALEVKSLETAVIEVPAIDVEKKPLAFTPCEGSSKHCEKLTLEAQQKLLAVGVFGNTLKLAVHDACLGGQETLSVSVLGEAPRFTVRGRAFSFESATLGGDRSLTSGFAKVPSELTGTGYVAREYLLTTRDAETLKFEAARNKQKYAPFAVSSQIVQVRGPQTCTTQFWKIGVEQCDFSGPDTNDFVLLGQNLIFVDADQKGMAWKPKGETREMLHQLEWIVSDGVNVALSSGGELYSAQPKWDLPELSGEKAPGAAGVKPLAFGCGRLLTKTPQGWRLRDVKKGVEWALDDGRIPGDAEADASPVMNCDSLLFPTGYKVSLRGLGASTPIAAFVPDPNPGATSEPASVTAPKE